MRISATERRVQLTEATIQLMRRDGVQSVTLRAIAEEAKASLATVHYCFTDKDELLRAAIDRWLKDMVAHAADAPTDEGLRGAVLGLAHRYWDALEDTPVDVLAQLELVIWAVRNDASNPLAPLIYPGYKVELGALFAQAMTNAQETCSMGIEALVRAFLVIIDGCSLQFLTQPTLSDHRELCFWMMQALLDNAGIDSAARTGAAASAAIS
ncbi:MAG TPA: TetR/AcrR family transcriptional regulator [Homoserinimonas sp.]|nr:TetR/AcrR family transcriptional regulator [Homoserinimonas sp.]